MTKTPGAREKARELVQQYARLETDPDKLQAMEDALMALYSLRVESQQHSRAVHDDLVKRKAEAARRAAGFHFSDRVIAEMLDMHRGQVFNYRQGRTNTHKPQASG